MALLNVQCTDDYKFTALYFTALQSLAVVLLPYISKNFAFLACIKLVAIPDVSQ